MALNLIQIKIDEMSALDLALFQQGLQCFSVGCQDAKMRHDHVETNERLCSKQLLRAKN